MKPVDFKEIMDLLTKGEPVSEEELVDAMAYADAGAYLNVALAKSLSAAYRLQQATIKRKNALLEAKIREIQKLHQTIENLNQIVLEQEKRLREPGAEGNA